MLIMHSAAAHISLEPPRLAQAATQVLASLQLRLNISEYCCDVPLKPLLRARRADADTLCVEQESGPHGGQVTVRPQPS
jgi:hypothetical protein